MKNRKIAWLLAVSGLVAATSPAQAIDMKTDVMSVYQIGNTAGVYVGHVVSATTNMNRLEAGGTFRASCMSPDTGDITGARTLSAESLVGPVKLVVTIPQQLPARRNMPGWEGVPRGSTLYCTYAWSSYAREGTMNLGVPPISLPVGGGQASDGGTRNFTMRKPGTATGDDDACIP